MDSSVPYPKESTSLNALIQGTRAKAGVKLNQDFIKDAIFKQQGSEMTNPDPNFESLFPKASVTALCYHCVKGKSSYKTSY